MLREDLKAAGISYEDEPARFRLPRASPSIHLVAGKSWRPSEDGARTGPSLDNHAYSGPILSRGLVRSERGAGVASCAADGRGSRGACDWNRRCEGGASKCLTELLTETDRGIPHFGAPGRTDGCGYGGRSRAQEKPLRNKAKTLFRRGLKAERSGFEPEMPVSRHTGLAIRRFRPLSHLSGVDLGEVSGKPRLRGDYSRKTPQIQGQPIAARAKEVALGGAAISGPIALPERRSVRRRSCRVDEKPRAGRGIRAATLHRRGRDPSFGTRRVLRSAAATACGDFMREYRGLRATAARRGPM